VSLVVVALVAGGSAVAGLAVRWALTRRSKAVTEAPAPAATALPEGSPRRTPSVLARAGFDIDMGDVVDIGGRELWLEHAWLMSEEREPVAALLSASDASLVVLPPPSKSVFLLQEVELTLGDEPPTSIESRGVRFERARRLPIRVEPLGNTPPLPWDEAIFAEYRALGGDSLWVLARGGRAKAWQGRVVLESEIERWGGGQDTLE